MTALSRRQLTIVAALLFGVAGGTAVRAQDASAWNTQTHASARLIAGSASKTGDKNHDASFVRAGVEIKLDPGWKTYWRYPGDSGVPPTLDFSGSENVKSVSVLWPAPKLFSDGAGGHSIGYMGDIILPLRVIAKDAAKQPSLHLKLGYAICANLCVPAEAELTLALSGDGAEEKTIERAEVHVPRHVALGAGKDLVIRSVHREADGIHDRVVVEVAAPDDAPVQLFVEGPTPEWSLPLPEPVGPAAALQRFTFEVDGLPPGAEAKGAALTFTAVSRGDAIEVPTHLD
jgi:DsbC/DsbD-like thiol-disulfide interchange protein